MKSLYMPKNSKGCHCGTFILLALLILLAYGNSLRGDWQFDDYINILRNDPLHLKDLHPSSIVKTFFASIDSDPLQKKKLYRPVACFSLALNWYAGQKATFGYHAVNLLIHILCAWLLFSTLRVLFRMPVLEKRYTPEQEHFIALLAAALWALNPVQTQAVTYIVQRMASMATLFYLVSIRLYLEGRLAATHKKAIYAWLGCGIAFLLAIGSKENAILAPLSFLLIEAAFFDSKPLMRFSTRRFIVGTALLVLIVFLTLLLSHGHPLSFLKGFQERPFTLLERLMTQPRVLIFYLSQLFYPIPQRLSVVHDITVSTSLWAPWTTLPAILLVLALIAAGIQQLKKRPLLGFGILFFFLNHLIESTILPLEMAFEHRNYLPSLFLFWPVAAAICRLLAAYRHRAPAMFGILAAFVSLIIMLFGVGTFVRNRVWATPKSLWTDVLKKYPLLARPYQQLGLDCMQKGAYDTAALLFTKSLNLKDPRPFQAKALALTNLGDIAFQKGDTSLALKRYRAALAIYPGYTYARYHMVLRLIHSGRWDAALENIKPLLAPNPNQVEYLNIRGFIRLWQGEYQKGISDLRRVLRLQPEHRGALINLGMTLSRMGHPARGEWFLRRAASLYPQDSVILLCLLENGLQQKDPAKSAHYFDRLFESMSLEKLVRLLKSLSQDAFELPPLSGKLLIPAISERLEKVAD